jgi:hypothetical protein
MTTSGWVIAILTLVLVCATIYYVGAGRSCLHRAACVSVPGVMQARGLPAQEARQRSDQGQLEVRFLR